MRHDVLSEVDYTLPVTITRLGHEPIIPHGHAVKCIHGFVNLYDELNSEIDRNIPEMFLTERRATGAEAGVGLVFDHRYHVCPLELTKARLKFDRGKQKHHLEEVCEHLWYCVMFKKGHFWVRYDWLETLTMPVVN